MYEVYNLSINPADWIAFENWMDLHYPAWICGIGDHTKRFLTLKSKNLVSGKTIASKFSVPIYNVSSEDLVHISLVWKN